MNAPEYRIETLHDFMKVPEDRLKACLEEFHFALTTHRLIEEFAGEKCDFIFTWIDDGKQDVTIDI